MSNDKGEIEEMSEGEDDGDFIGETESTEEQIPDDQIEKVGHVFLPEDFSDKILSVIPHNDRKQNFSVLNVRTDFSSRGGWGTDSLWRDGRQIFDRRQRNLGDLV